MSIGELEGWVQAKYHLEISKNGEVKIEELFDYPSYKKKENELKKNKKP
jgi:hypothetical protein